MKDRQKEYPGCLKVGLKTDIRLMESDFRSPKNQKTTDEGQAKGRSGLSKSRVEIQYRIDGI